MRKPKKNKFDYDLDAGDYAKPRPKVDADGEKIAEALSKLRGRQQTGWVVNWAPSWLPKVLPPFRFYFHEDRLAVDLFVCDRDEIDAFDSPTTQAQEQEIQQKTGLCREKGIEYIPVRPDDELTAQMIAGRLGLVKAKVETSEV